MTADAPARPDPSYVAGHPELFEALSLSLPAARVAAADALFDRRGLRRLTADDDHLNRGGATRRHQVAAADAHEAVRAFLRELATSPAGRLTVATLWEAHEHGA